MQINNSRDFQNYIFKQLTFSPYPKENYTLYTNPDRPELGYCCQYVREGCYALGIAEYTIPEDFSVTFSNPDPQLRFGTLFDGKTHFKLFREQASSFSPASFLVYEKNIKGQQVWMRDEHFHGIEFTVYPQYLTEVLLPQFKDCVNFEDFIQNYTYKFLPARVIALLGQMMALHEADTLTPLYLEGLLMQCLAVLALEFDGTDEPHSAGTVTHIPVGTDRYLSIQPEERQALETVHEILTTNFANPPTIHELSSQVLLPTQKLKYAFRHYYHTTIHAYVLSLRMTEAARLLQTSSLRVEEIGAKVGYPYPGNFISVFKKTYGITPLQFRRSKSDTIF